MKNKGFTLIELLVVVAVIGVLASIVLSSLSDVRVRARDAKRLADIRTIQSALEIYNLDNGKYPTVPTGVSGAWSGSNTSNWDALEILLGTTLPVDPLNTSIGNEAQVQAEGNYVYTYFALDTPDWCNAQCYFIAFQLEGRNGNGSNDGIEMPYNGGTLFTSGGITFVVGMDRNGILKTADTSGTPK